MLAFINTLAGKMTSCGMATCTSVLTAQQNQTNSSAGSGSCPKNTCGCFEGVWVGWWRGCDCVSNWILTPSLPWCKFKTTNKSAKFETLKPFFPFLYSHWHVKGFSSKCIALKVDVLKDRKIYCSQARPCVFQSGNFTGWGFEGVNSPIHWTASPQ